MTGIWIGSHSMGFKNKGFYYGWWVVSACFFIYMLIGGVTLYGMSAFFNPMLLENGWTRAQTSLAHSLRSIEGGLIQPFIGIVIDRLGARKCIFAGLIIIGGSFFLLSQVHSLIPFYAIFLLMALGNGLGIGNAEFVAASNWFKKRRSFALGIVSSGFAFSGLMTPVIIYLIHTFGWRHALMIIGLGSLAIGLPLAYIIKQRHEHHESVLDNREAEELGYLNVDINGSSEYSAPETDHALEGMSIRECLKTRVFWVIIAYSLFVGFCHSAISVLSIPALISNHISTGLAGWTVTGMMGFSLIGRLGFSYLGDLYDKRKLLAIAATLQAIGCLIFSQIHAPWMILLFVVFYGPGFGAHAPLLPAIQADVFGLKNFATIRGLSVIGFAIPGVIAPYFAGWTYDLTKSYNPAFILYGVICLFAAPTIMLIRDLKQKPA
jgi:MFS family permease